MKTETQHTPTLRFTNDELEDLIVHLGLTEAEAVHVVRAVNAHEELLAFAYKIKNATMLSKKWNELAEQAITKSTEGRS